MGAPQLLGHLRRQRDRLWPHLDVRGAERIGGLQWMPALHGAAGAHAVLGTGLADGWLRIRLRRVSGAGRGLALAAAFRLVQRPAEPRDLRERLLKLRAQRGVLTREGVPFVAERLRVVRCHPPNGTEPRGMCPAPRQPPQRLHGLDGGTHVPEVSGLGSTFARLCPIGRRGRTFPLREHHVHFDC